MAASADLTLWTARLAAMFSSLATALYAAAGIEPYPLIGVLPKIAVFIWLERDAGRTGVCAVHDLGFFLFLGWPVLIPWYAFKSRGAAGWRLLSGLFALILAPDVTGVLVSALVYYRT
jgi:hypothetical protein